jgi:hypothetical protein
LIERHAASIKAYRAAQRDADRLGREVDSGDFIQKIMDAAGKPREPDGPLNVYHGTDSTFDRYSGDIARSKSDSAKQVGIDTMFVTPRKEFAETFGTPMRLELQGGHYFDIENMGDLARIAPYINSRSDATEMWRKIERVLTGGGQTWGMLEGRDMVAEMKRLGYDGVKMTEDYYPRENKRTAPTMAVFSKGKVLNRDTGETVFSRQDRASAPGLAANSTQQPERPVRQDDQGVMSILRRYGLAD